MHARAEWEAAYELTRLFVANQLGPRPVDDAGEDAAIARASNALEASPLEEARRAQRFLAIEYTAWRLARERAEDDDEHDLEELPKPTADHWRVAIVIVDADDHQGMRSRARAGMVIRAAQGGWAADEGEDQ